MSIPASVLMKIATLGLSEDQARAVAEMLADVETATKAETAGALEARRASDRNRKARQRHVMSRDVTGQDVTNRDTLPPSPFPLDPPSQTLPPIIPQTPSTIPAKKRATRLSSDWVLPRAWGEWAVEQGYPEPTIRLEAEKFRDFWIAKGGRDAAKLDWEATWRNWMRNCAKRQPNRGPPVKERTMKDAINDFISRNSGDEPGTGPTIEHDERDFTPNVHLLAASTRRGS